MENGDSNYADSGAAADGCGCSGCDEAWRQAWALRVIEEAEASCSVPLSYAATIDLVLDHSDYHSDAVDIVAKLDAELLVLAAEGLRRRLARYAAEQALEEAKAEVERLRVKLESAYKLESDGPRYEHPTCKAVPVGMS